MIRIFSLLFVVCFLFLVKNSPVFAQAEDQCNGKSGQSKIACYEEALDKFRGQIQNFSNEIKIRKTQINLTGARIAQTEKQIEQLTAKISRLEVSLDFLSEILTKRIVLTYKTGQMDILTLLLSSNGFSDFLNRYKYLKAAQLHDKQIILSMEEARTNYDQQRTETEDLKKQLENQKAILAQQQKELEFLLQITRNQEKVYKDLLARALAEQAATQRAISQALKDLESGKGDPVTAGQTIAVMGNSGSPDCSTGPHLHFTVLKDGTTQNPANFLKNASFTWDNPDSPLSFTGNWDWPLSNPRITQSYGETYYVRVLGWYGGKIHDGIDMVSDNTTIKAPTAGKIIRGSTSCDSSHVAGVSTLKFAAIAHGDGVISIYLHIQ